MQFTTDDPRDNIPTADAYNILQKSSRDFFLSPKKLSKTPTCFD
jgi:hypothetical protein